MQVCEKQTLYTQKHYTRAISCTKIIFMLKLDGKGVPGKLPGI